MLLGSIELSKLVSEKNLIEDFNPDCLESAGYDLRAGRFYRLNSRAKMADERVMPEAGELLDDELKLSPGDYVLVESLEKVNIPVDLCARILPKSSLFRCGGSLETALVDPGFSGTLTMGLSYNAGYSLTVLRNAKIAQIVFEKVEGQAKAYDGRFQGGRVV
ncbi:MAG: hypothetical protein GF334_02005 [Candidatus Altiarchaeales archaeon]|nr:hypothetical protein [Candidatus Altiarchaeales archaeon]